MSATAVLDKFSSLESALNTFHDTLPSQATRIWYPSESGDFNHEQAIQACQNLYTNIWHEGNQDGRLTITHPGLVAATPNLIELAKQVNETKTEFQAAINTYKADYPAQWRDLYPEMQRHLKVKSLFSGHNLSRLHLKQAYRHIPILETAPTKVGFSWYANGKSICRITAARARELLLKLNDQAEHIHVQLSQLKPYPDDYPLARIQTQAPVLRANLVFQNSSDEIARKAMNVSMPIIFPDNSEFPHYRLKSLTPPPASSRQRRSDVAIEDTPFLPSLRVHKYINQPM